MSETYLRSTIAEDDIEDLANLLPPGGQSTSKGPAGWRRPRKAVALLAGALGLASACVFVRRRWACSTNAAPTVFTGSDHAESILKLFADQPVDEDFMHRWLAAASKVGVAANERSESANDKLALEIVADKTINAVLNSKDDETVDAVIQRAVNKAVRDTHVKHTEIKDLVIAGASAKLLGTVLKTAKKANTFSTVEKAKRAQCVVRSGYAMSLIFQAGSDIHDSVLTCPHSAHGRKGNFMNNTRGQVCAINIGEAQLDLVALSAILTTLADDCAASLIPNIDVLCAASVLGFLTAFSQFAGLGVLFQALCGPNHPPTPEGVTPSNLGARDQDPNSYKTLFPYLDFHGWQPGYHLHERTPEEVAADPDAAAAKAAIEAAAAHRRLEVEPEPAGAAPERRLIYGGGKASTGIQCFADISDIAWFLAMAGLSISSASGHTGLLGGCPPKNIFGSTKKTGGSFYHWAEVYCLTDVAGVISFMLGAASFMQFAVVNCGDVLDIPAICGASITGIMSAAAGTAQAAMGLHLTCDPSQFGNPKLKKLVDVAREIDIKSGYKITHLLGRRLEDFVGEQLDGIAALKEKFATPEEAWRSIGMDLSKPPENLRQELKDHAPPPLSKEELRAIVLGERAAPETTGLFETNDQCF